MAGTGLKRLSNSFNDLLMVSDTFKSVHAEARRRGWSGSVHDAMEPWTAIFPPRPPRLRVPIDLSPLGALVESNCRAKVMLFVFNVLLKVSDIFDFTFSVA